MITAVPIRALSRTELAALAERYADEVRQGCFEVGHSDGERWHVRLHRDELVDVWLIAWPTSLNTELHDHGGSAGVFTVVEGTLTEDVWNGDRLESRTLRAGETSRFGPAYVHDVRNDRPQQAVSVHVYSPPLSQMNYYDVEDGELRRLATSWTDDPEAPAPAYASVDDLLEAARSTITRYTPLEAAAAVAAGAQLVDIRPAWQREVDGEVPGAVVIERNHLEWRVHPKSDARLPIARPGQKWIIFCTEGYTSSLAAASLVSLGLQAADVEGGIRGWAAAGLPVVAGPTPVEQVVRSA
ncbi:hypothetical protein Back2_08640 [Nocardioides baekrokdamisoli]|uniref:Rhodanese domain-containing protein n=1 Tax=Nocardioides baekrokdamisoli TaxID=1804624 RepID=A0A3G9ICC5_9ACTN|nr:rhodanese-like domain-containing protein [Nocardioides baekrokdamisoli]BBH16577.1 hypothetical protein Back2_08640 [Nocardioides baekrokdamisoli]